MMKRIGIKCTRAMKILSLASGNTMNDDSDQSSMNNTSQSSLEGTFSVSNYSTSSICNPGYLEVSSDYLKSNQPINESNEEMQLGYSENGNGLKNTPNCFSKSNLTDGDEDRRDPDEDEKNKNSTNLNEEIFQRGCNRQIKKKIELDSEIPRRLPTFSTDTLQNKDKPFSAETRTIENDLAKLDSDDDIQDTDYNLEEDSSSDSSEEDEETENSTDLNEKIFQHGSSKQMKKKSETDSKSGRRVPAYSTETLQNMEKPISVETQTIENELAENKSSSSKKSKDDRNNNDLSSQLITVNHRSLEVETSNHNTKKHFCTFCKTKQSKLARHFLNKHRNEEDVIFFSKLPVKSRERLSIISKLRKQGDALYNRDENYNNGDIIVVRRPQVEKKRKAQHYLPCGECSAMYSILSLRAHYKKCCKTKYKFQRNVLVESRSKTFINLKANSIMRNKILPPMRVDEIGKLVRNEDLIILFGNRLTQKYRSPHLHKMIRSRLRCVANFYWHYQQRNPQIRNFDDVFDPQNYDEVIISINKLAGLNEDTGQYKAPATAANIGTYLKKLSLYLISEMIKQKNSRKLQDVREFLQLLEDSLTYDILKTVTENQLTMRRNKIISLPSIDDISLLRNHLNKKIKLNFGKLRDKFSITAWKELSGALLIALQLFNRRRAGEIERTKIQDFVQHESVNVNDEMACDLEGEHIENYVRFLIRGKKGRDVPVLVDKYKLKCLKLVLEYREMAGTPVTNPYVFGISGKDNFQHLDANKLIVSYANTCGAKYPERLRGTQLRKHFATKCGTMQLKDIEIKDVADYMGHHEKIHLEHYRMPNATRDIVRMSQLLEKAQGVENSSTFMEWNPICNIIDPSEAEKQDESAPLEKNADGLELNSSRRCSIKRLSWNTKEKALVDTKAKFYIENCESPTLSYCSSLIKEEEMLQNRTPNTLKAYIMNRIKRRKESLLTPKPKKCKRGVKKYWTDEEREKMKEIFQNELKQNKLPSLATCRKVLKENSILSDRTPEMLKAFINNTLKKK